MRPLLSLVLICFSSLSAAADRSMNMPMESRPCAGKQSYPVHLTFDDGPNSKLTPKILDTLKAYNVKATFFITTYNLVPEGSPEVLRRKALIERAKAEGHHIASHTHQHIDHTHPKYSMVEATENLRRSRELLGDENSKNFRYPYGAGWIVVKGRDQRAATVRNTATKLGMRHVGWDIDTWDWSAAKRKDMPRSMLAQICSTRGGVVLMHDIQPFTANNLPKIIDSIRSSGHRIVDFSEIEAYSESLDQGLVSFAPIMNPRPSRVAKPKQQGAIQ